MGQSVASCGGSWSFVVLIIILIILCWEKTRRPENQLSRKGATERRQIDAKLSAQRLLQEQVNEDDPKDVAWFPSSLGQAAGGTACMQQGQGPMSSTSADCWCSLQRLRAVWVQQGVRGSWWEYAAARLGTQSGAGGLEQGPYLHRPFPILPPTFHPPSPSSPQSPWILSHP